MAHILGWTLCLLQDTYSTPSRSEYRPSIGAFSDVFIGLVLNGLKVKMPKDTTF